MTQLPNSSMHGEAPEPDDIQREPSAFEAGYMADSLPRITVPDLPEDALGLSAEALAKVPTLTELVSDVTAETEPSTAQMETEPIQVMAYASAEVEAEVEAELEAEADAASLQAQDLPTQADQWNEELQARMGKLTDDIQTLNARLDRLEELNKTKV
jgi:outer membrane murein-binding lipoprotein Lpp